MASCRARAAAQHAAQRLQQYVRQQQRCGQEGKQHLNRSNVRAQKRQDQDRSASSDMAGTGQGRCHPVMAGKGGSALSRQTTQIGIAVTAQGMKLLQNPFSCSDRTCPRISEQSVEKRDRFQAKISLKKLCPLPSENRARRTQLDCGLASEVWPWEHRVAPLRGTIHCVNVRAILCPAPKA